MSEPCDPCASGPREVNPLLFLLFCPNCVLSGIFAVAATGLVTVPPLFGIAPENYLAPAVVLGTLMAWIGWGYWRKNQGEGQPTPRRQPTQA